MIRASLEDLELLEAVARHGSFRRAATELRISPSSATERIRALEDRVGARLLNRTTRSVRTTEVGAGLLARLRPALGEIAAALDAAGEGAAAVSGLLRINAPPPATQLVLAPLITRFVPLHPRVVMDVTSESGFVDIVSAGYDAGVRYGESLARDMIAVPLGGTQRYVVVASPALIARTGRPAEPQALLRLPCIRTRFGNGTMLPWEFERDGEVVTIRPEGPLITTDAQLGIAAAIEGLGFYVTFDGWARPALEAGQLVTVLDDWLPPFDGPFLYYPSRRHMPAALRAFVDFVKGSPGTPR
ncbi:DNA-binding transcriptional regulator, LysR family [Roseomonas rosea]|uniref:DNA-binding transcriptional regulator, LysR family n=1 Tax=Muricoccus roseus TaxID=198092 RepID=A0A1M6INB4_9PROT|nr:LysR family transcriptional regulator [Roseomonas rosea]SHJ35932.1 DNA-binding transcriptional regulator, LysR family [Roseomonas rosea]